MDDDYFSRAAIRRWFLLSPFVSLFLSLSLRYKGRSRSTVTLRRSLRAKSVRSSSSSEAILSLFHLWIPLARTSLIACDAQ